MLMPYDVVLTHRPVIEDLGRHRLRIVNNLMSRDTYDSRDHHLAS